MVLAFKGPSFRASVEGRLGTWGGERSDAGSGQPSWRDCSGAGVGTRLLTGRSACAGFPGQTSSGTTAQLCGCSMEAAERGSVPTELNYGY